MTHPRTGVVLVSLVIASCWACIGPSETGVSAGSPQETERFRLGLQSRLAGAGDAPVITGEHGWLFFGPELRHLTVGPFWGHAASAVSRATRPEDADPLPAILDFRRQLDDLGVRLLVVPVPAKAIIYPDEVAPGPFDTGRRLDEYDEAFIDVLRGEHVDVLDLTPVFLENLDHPEGHLYCRQDTHWSSPGTVLAAERIAAIARHASWYADAPRAAIETEWRSVEITGDLWRLLGDDSRPRERVRLRFVGTRAGPVLEPVATTSDSPVLVLGDSHGLVFHAGDDMHARGAGLADQLAYELGFPVELIAVRGSGATPARFNLLRQARRTDGYWGRKRLVVWVFSVREFTESDGWRRVPVL